MFRLEGEAVQVADAAFNFKNALEALPASIDALSAINCHINNVPADGNWTLVLHAQCADEAALATYAAHPAHIACVAIIKPLIAARACVDYKL